MRQGGWSYIKAQLLITGPVLLLVNILVVQSAQEIFNFEAMQDPDQLLTDMLDNYGIALLISFISAALLPAVTFAYMRTYEAVPLGEIQLNQVWQKAIRKFPSILGYIIILVIVTTVSGVIVIMMFSVLGAIGAFFGVFIAFAAMLTVANTFSLGLPVIAFEDRDPISAMGRSIKLIQGKWFSTLGIIVITFIIAMVVNMVFGMPRSIMYGIWMMNSLDVSTGTFASSDMPFYMQVLDMLFAVISTFGTLISYSVIYLGLSFQFFNLVERQDSKGLMAQIEALETHESTEEEDETY